ncbi:MAG: hypothetical protein Q7S30_01750, partial [Candidatus Omnitrophota bacterium]|nr:hypothetical protein [Candidatus Omnitrophota bacterium]
MDWQSPHNKWWIRIIAIVLTIAFINQDIIWAQDGAPVWSKQSRPEDFVTRKGAGNDMLFPGHETSIPRDIATVKEVYSPFRDPERHGEQHALSGSRNDNPKTIIQIQDAHSSLGAQESISSILDSLVTNYDLKLIAIEGSSGYIDTSFLKTFPDEKIRSQTAKYLVKEGRMSAGEFFSITSNKPIALYGIEDKPLYKE